MSGASATIASDALMNPFDGKVLRDPVILVGFANWFLSHEATYAGSRLCSQDPGTMRQDPLSH